MSGYTRHIVDVRPSIARGMRDALLLVVMLPAAGLHLQAQSNVGQLSEIRGSRDKQACAVTGSGVPANPVRVNSGTGSQWRPLNPTFPREQLRVGDRITVRREVDARVVIDEPSGMGADITLAPKLVCSFVGVDQSAGVPSDSGAYSLTRSRDTVVFTVNRGAAYIRWTDPSKRCLLKIVAQLQTPILARVCGTQLVVSVDATGTAGYLYVIDGTVIIIGGAAALITATQGQLVRLGRTNFGVADGRVAERVDSREIRYHSKDIWNPRPGFWSRPSTYIWGGILGGATAVAITQPWKSDVVRAPVRKTVVVHIPL